MKCRNCKKTISKDKVFCDECSEKLKDSSSTKDLEELQELIQERDKMKDLETTKEVVVEKEEVKETNTLVNEIDDDFKDVKDNKLLTLIVVLLTLIFIVVVGFIAYKIITDRKTEKAETKEVIDYEKIINSYGEIVSKEAKKYIETKEEVPTWQALSELLEYKDYEVVCQVHNIYIDGSVYLKHCKVNNKTVKYTYGKEQEDAKKGKELSIYKVDSKYTSEGSEDTLVKTLVCNTVNCKYSEAFDKYVIVEERSAYYLYNYETNTLEFGPFKEFKVLNYNDTLYGIYYKADGLYNIYNVTLGKTLKNVKGNIDFSKTYVDTGIQYKYNYIILQNTSYDFVNLKTGNISFSIAENIQSFIEDVKSGILYITTGDTIDSKFRIYNSNGKLMFEGVKFIDFKIVNNELITITENYFRIYDNKLNLKVSSGNYTKILKAYDDFVIVLDKSKLKIVNYSDKVVAEFENEWSDDYTIFDKSFKYNVKDKVIDIVFKNKTTNKYICYTYSFNDNKITETVNKDMN